MLRCLISKHFMNIVHCAMCNVHKKHKINNCLQFNRLAKWNGYRPVELNDKYYRQKIGQANVHVNVVKVPETDCEVTAMMKTGDNNNGKPMKMEKKNICTLYTVHQPKKKIFSHHISLTTFSQEINYTYILQIFSLFLWILNQRANTEKHIEHLNIENFRCLVSNAIIALLSSYIFSVISYNLSRKKKRNTFFEYKMHIAHCTSHRWFVIWLVDEWI